jgi:proline iminopeptidase
MILRGYFPGTRVAKQFLEQGGTGLFFPEAWARLDKLVPVDQKINISAYYLNQLLTADDDTRMQYANELVSFNVATAKIGITEQELNMIVNTGDVLGKAIIQCHYSANDFFIPQNYILDNIDLIKHLRISIIHGRYDMICPPVYAYELFNQLDNATLDIVTGGHLSAEPEIEKLLRIKISQLSPS